MDFSSSVLTLETSGHVATLWLDRPEKRNAMSQQILRDLPRAMAAIADCWQIAGCVEINAN